MHQDLSLAAGDQILQTEICVVGSGAAGISTARRLLSLGHSVLLLESGGLDYEADIARLNAGENRGEDYYDLEDARLRFFGGTTAIWGGRVAELDPIDLEKRDWVPHSGWPMAWADLDSYYAPARKIFGFSGKPAPDALAQAGVPAPDFDPDKLEIGYWSFDQKFNRFVFDACKDLRDHPRCTIVTHATVTDLTLNSDGNALTGLTARSLNGNTLRVHAHQVVLAAGGMENPRLLLASRSVAPYGIGNHYDQVGRYFMEHPHARGGRILNARAWQLLEAFGRRHRLPGYEFAALVKPSAALQADQSILNTSLILVARQPAHARQALAARMYSRIKHNVAPTRGGRALWMTAKNIAKTLQQGVDPLRPWVMHRLGLCDMAISIRAEQAPNPQSRVTLTDQMDALGVPRLALDWRTTALDVRSVSVLVDTLGRELHRLGQGRAEPAPWLKDLDGGWQTDPLISAHPIGGYHHMGTTRMSDDPRLGVTDGYGRVHGVENLYVVGSSTFPTSGWANPTLTIVALALRTSDHISARMTKQAVA